LAADPSIGKARDVSFRRTPPPGSGLHQCRLCHDDYVVPVWWEESGDDHWHMLLRCAQCETFRDVTVGDDVAAAYERDLQRGMAEIAATLERSDRAQMLAELPVLIAALERDLIDAADFAPRWTRTAARRPP
jgi:hypothetical protein